MPGDGRAVVRGNRELAERRMKVALSIAMYTKDVIKANGLDVEDIAGATDGPLTATGRWAVVGATRWVECDDAASAFTGWFAINPNRIGADRISQQRTVMVESFGDIINHPIYTEPETILPDNPS